MNLEHLLSKEDLQIRDSIREFTKKEIITWSRKSIKSWLTWGFNQMDIRLNMVGEAMVQ